MARIHYVVAGCVVSAAAFSFAGDGKQSGSQTRCPHGPAHAVELISTEAAAPADEKVQAQVITVVADAANRVFSNRGLDSILELVAKGDRDRVGKDLDKKEEQQFVKAADAVARAWREKYGSNFDASENTQALKNLGVTMSKDEQGRDRATVEFPSMNGRSRFEMHLVKEGTEDWRIVLPDRINGSNFGGQMARSMEQVAQQAGKENWPDDRSMAYLNVTSQALHTLGYEHQRTADTGRD
jgi:hypothetical protein